MLPTLLLVFIFSTYFTLQLKLRPDTNQGAPLPYQTASNVLNGKPSRPASPRARKEGYRKNNGCRFYSSQYGLLIIFCPLTSNKDATYLFPNHPQWSQPLSHGASAAAPPSLMPDQTCHRDTKHTGCQGIWIGAGNPVSGARGFRRDATDGSKDTYRVVLPQPPGLQRDVFKGSLV